MQITNLISNLKFQISNSILPIFRYTARHDANEESGTGSRLVAGLGALAFSFGINWGLSSTAREEYLKAQKGDQDAHSLSLSGAGIDHLAGGWEEDRARASDVELHPITDRSAPVTLLDNPVGLSARQIIEKGDAKLAAMQKDSAALLKKWNDLYKANSQSPEIAPIQTKYVDALAAIDAYVLKYNQDKTPGYREGQSADPTIAPESSGDIVSIVISPMK